MVANMDGRAWVSLGVSFLLFGGVGLVFVFGARLLGFDSEAALEGWFGAAHGPWALPAAVAAFAALAFAAGTALGIIPKIALTAFAGGAAFRALTGGGIGHLFLLALAAAAWIGMGFLAREWVRKATSSTPEA